MLLAAGLIAACALWFGLRWHVEFQWGLFLRTFTEMHWGWLSASVFLVMLTYVGRVIRWRVMLKPLRPHANFWNLFSATVVGFTAVVLFGRAGELVRPYLISTREKVPFSSQLAAWLLERIYDLLSVLLLFGFALTQLHSTSTKIEGTLAVVMQTGGHLAGALASICLSLLIVFGLFPHFAENRLLQALAVLPEGWRQKLETIVRAFVQGTSSTRRGWFVIQLVLYTVGEWMLIVGCFWCVFKAFPATMGMEVLDVLIIVGFVAFGSAVQIPGVGGGVQVATIFVLTELYRIPVEVASGVALLLWVVAFVTVAPLGLALALHEGLQLRKLLKTEEIQPLQPV